MPQGHSPKCHSRIIFKERRARLLPTDAALTEIIDSLLHLPSNYKRQLADLLRRAADDDDSRHPA